MKCTVYVKFQLWEHGLNSPVVGLSDLFLSCGKIFLCLEKIVYISALEHCSKIN